MPIILIIMVIIDLSKIIMNPKKEEVSGSLSKIVKRTIAAIAVFLLPAIISYAFEALITNYDNELKVCYENASIERINELIAEQKKAREAERLKEQQKLQEALDERNEKEGNINESLKENREENEVDENAGTTFEIDWVIKKCVMII